MSTWPGIVVGGETENVEKECGEGAESIGCISLLKVCNILVIKNRNEKECAILISQTSVNRESEKRI
jgi:hypothetical protein